MDNGFYNHKKINFEAFAITKFTPHLYDAHTYSLTTCGANTLSLLTGISPFVILKLNKYHNHTSDKFMVNFLKNHGFKVAKLTKCHVSNQSGRLLENKIQHYHLLLLSQLVLKNEATWSVLQNSYIYHNFEINLLRGLEFVNRPIVSAFLLFHKKYK